MATDPALMQTAARSERAPYGMVALASFLAQAAAGFCSVVVIGAVMFGAFIATAGRQTDAVDYFVSKVNDLAGASTSVLWYALLLFLTASFCAGVSLFATPPLFARLVRAFTHRRLGYWWALGSLAAAWAVAAIVTLLFWLIPGAQLIALPLTLALSVAISTALACLRLDAGTAAASVPVAALAPAAVGQPPP